MGQQNRSSYEKHLKWCFHSTLITLPLTRWKIPVKLDSLICFYRIIHIPDLFMNPFRSCSGYRTCEKNPFKCQPHKMVRHIKTISRQLSSQMPEATATWTIIETWQVKFRKCVVSWLRFFSLMVTSWNCKTKIKRVTYFSLNITMAVSVYIQLY